MGPQDQVFTWEEPNTKVVYNFNSTAMYNYWRKHPDCGEEAMVPLSKELYEDTKRDKGIEKHRLDRITKRDLKKYHILWAEWETDEEGEVWHTCFDGSHRIVWAYEHGIFQVKSLIFKKPAWSKCLIRYPDPRLDQVKPNPNSFSGIF